MKANQAIESEIENASVHLGKTTDEFLLAEDADLEAGGAEFDYLNEYGYGTLTPFGWDSV